MEVLADSIVLPELAKVRGQLRRPISSSAGRITSSPSKPTANASSSSIANSSCARLLPSINSKWSSTPCAA